MIPILDPWVNVAIFKHESEAWALAERLHEQGFESRSRDDHKVQMFWFFAPPRATYRVQVNAKDAAAAQEFVETDFSAKPLIKQAIHCPECKSIRIEYPQMTRRFITPTILLDLAILFRIIDHQAYCQECHYTWRLRRHSHAHAVKAKRVAT